MHDGRKSFVIQAPGPGVGPLWPEPDLTLEEVRETRWHSGITFNQGILKGEVSLYR
jgi:hypothetical protein